jgi:hypothetical protein
MEWQRLDQNGLGQLRADAEPDVADLANDVVLLAQEPDMLVLAKTQFSQSKAHFWRSGELLDPDGAAGADFAERTQTWIRAAWDVHFMWNDLLLVMAARNLWQLRLGCKKQFAF